MIKNILLKTVAEKNGGKVEADEIGLKTEDGLVLPCGNSGIWMKG